MSLPLLELRTKDSGEKSMQCETAPPPGRVRQHQIALEEVAGGLSDPLSVRPLRIQHV